jgi:hypothetical protein
VRLNGTDCLDLRKLPQGWKVASYSTTTWGTFGVPGTVALHGDVPYDLLINVGAKGYGNIADYRDYGEQWVKRTPLEHGRWGHNSAWDVPGFKAYPADDGEIVYVGKYIDGLMECSVGESCTVHDGINRLPVALDVSFAYGERHNALNHLNFARRMLNDLKIRC